MGRLLLAVALLSAAALGTEVVLLRLFAIVQWQHVASTVVSMALLGYGVSGTVLSLTRRWADRHFTRLFAANAVLFAVFAVAAPIMAQAVPFNPVALFWETGQIARLAGIYALAALPFLFAANAIGLALLKHRRRPHGVYAADLTGAGLGALASLGLLGLWFPGEALRPLAAIGLVAAAIVLSGWPGRAILGLGAVAVLFVPVPLQPSPYKDLSRALTRSEARVVAEASGPLGTLTAVESPAIPFRYAPGLAITSPRGPPPQRGLFIDGERAGAIDRRQQTDARSYLDHLPSALPYSLLAGPRILVLGGSDGRPVDQALAGGARSVHVVERDANLIHLIRALLGEWSGNLLNAEAVTIKIAEPRAFVESSADRWDLIQVTSGVTGGGFGLRETTVLTVEGMKALLSRTTDRGMIALTRPIRLPPRAFAKLTATAAAALRQLGVADPARHLIAIRGWHSATLLIGREPFTPEQVAATRSFASSRAFDLVWATGMKRSEANRDNRLEAPMFFDAARALLGPGASTYLSAAKYDLNPATDDQPFFADFFRWRLLPELLAKRDRGGIGLMEWGVPLLAATLLQAVVISPLLIILPLALAGMSRPAGTAEPGRLRILGFFLSLGLAFMTIEMAFIQRYVLLLGHPVYAASLTLAAFLVFAGLGSVASARLARILGGIGTVFRLAALAVAVLVAFNLAVFPVVHAVSAAWPLSAKVVVGLGLAAPLAFAMGQFFPLGLAAVGNRAPRLVPWAWAINGCASVLGVLIATLIAVHAGYAMILLLGTLLYAAAARWHLG